MKVRNSKCIRHLSYKTMMASKKRNIIAIIAIALTTLMFTALFTVVLSINTSYQNYLSRQVGAYSHGCFKEVSEEDIEKITGHRMIKEAGARTVIGIVDEIPFNKETAEVSFMDANCTKWSYALPSEGHMPRKEDEISMDRKALELLGVEGKIGEKITLTYKLYGKNGEGEKITDTFTLVGIFEYDALLPVHYINVSKEYVEKMENHEVLSDIGGFRTDLNVMLSNSLNIEGKLEQVRSDLGMDDTRIGVSWAYTGSSLSPDAATVVAMVAFLILVFFSGYLVIYNIFQISVTGDIRFYGLLKTIGVTPKQLKRIIRNQALMLCAPGIPLGFLVGYGVGAIILPLVIEATFMGKSATKLSTSPVIFLVAALFSLMTVLISCRKPGKVAAKISPVEASKYTDSVKKTHKKSRSVNGFKMALSNLGRNRKKTAIVIISLSLSLVLLNLLFAFVNGFDEEKYLERSIGFDFLISSSAYFRTEHTNEYFPEYLLEEVKENVHPDVLGCAYTNSGRVNAWMKEAGWLDNAKRFGIENPQTEINQYERKDGFVKDRSSIEGFDTELIDKLILIDGSLEPLKEAGGRYIAIEMPEGVDVHNIERDHYPEIGEKITVEYVEDYHFIDTRTGEAVDGTTPYEFIKAVAENPKEVEYTVCAYVSVPYRIGKRYYTSGYSMVLNKDTFVVDSTTEVIPMFIAFDTADAADEALAEAYLSGITSGDMNPLMYESKEALRAEFKEFKSMFLIVGGVLCAIIGLVGILNFFNAVMTEIMSRAKELAVLQAIGMTGRQLKQMLITEGLLYVGGSALFSLVLSLIVNPLEIAAVNSKVWFCSAKFTIMPVVFAVPAFVMIAFMVSNLLYNRMQKESIVERIREISNT